MFYAFSPIHFNFSLFYSLGMNIWSELSEFDEIHSTPTKRRILAPTLLLGQIGPNSDYHLVGRIWSDSNGVKGCRRGEQCRTSSKSFLLLKISISFSYLLLLFTFFLPWGMRRESKKLKLLIKLKRKDFWERKKVLLVLEKKRKGFWGEESFY